MNTKRTIIIIATALLIALTVCALAVGINVLTRKPNEENYVYMLYDSDSSYTDKSEKRDGITWTVKEDGSVIGDGVAKKNTYFTLGTVNFAAGSYTFTANDGSERDTYFVAGYDTVGVPIWYADMDNSDDGMIQTFGTETIVTLRIVVLEDTELKNVKFTPCIVEGKNPGEYYE